MEEIRIGKDGVKKWYKNDLLHCEVGPAIVSPDGIHSWYVNGKFLGSEIREGNSETTSLYINGSRMTKEEFMMKVLSVALKEKPSKENKVKI